VILAGDSGKIGKGLVEKGALITGSLCCDPIRSSLSGCSSKPIRLYEDKSERAESGNVQTSVESA
jgi:hypothetical protein